jgi:hypothetical protein
MALAIPGSVADDFVRVGQRARHRTARLSVRGTPPGRSVRITGAQKAEEVWGTSLSITVRGTRKSEDNADPFEVEVSNRRRKVLATETIDPRGLGNREEKTFTIRLRGVAFGDVASCRIVD